MPNIEMKARYEDLKKARQIAITLGATPLWSDGQIDTYFFTKAGKLKLRESTLNGAELIPYIKIDHKGLKRADYAKVPVSDPGLVKELLGGLLGTKLVVKKFRQVYLWENVRIHLDEVDGLGSFLEFEAVIQNDTPDALVGEKKKVLDLMAKFHVSKEQLLENSYVDLISNSFLEASPSFPVLA